MENLLNQLEAYLKERCGCSEILIRGNHPCILDTYPEIPQNSDAVSFFNLVNGQPEDLYGGPILGMCTLSQDKLAEHLELITSILQDYEDLGEDGRSVLSRVFQYQNRSISLSKFVPILEAFGGSYIGIDAQNRVYAYDEDALQEVFIPVALSFSDLLKFILRSIEDGSGRYDCDVDVIKYCNDQFEGGEFMAFTLKEKEGKEYLLS